MKMENGIVKTSKRKKRRTRKNLDEIKKRTLQVYNNNNNENEKKPKYTNCITNSRLTLAKKAIRSDTVTRSLLSNLDEESKNNMIVLSNTEVIDTLVSNENYKKEIIPFEANSKLKSSLRHYTEVDNYQTPVSIIIFSSPEREKVIKNITINEMLLDSSRSVALKPLMHSENSLYNDFMTNMVDYVRKYPSHNFKTDIIHIYKESFIATFIQNLNYNENKDTPDSLSHMNKYDVKTNISFTGNYEPVSQHPKCQSNINIQYSLGKLWNVPSPIFCQSYGKNLQKRNSSSSSGSSDQSSPEYFYYPHRLNQ